MEWVAIIALVVIAFLLLKTVRIVPQEERWVIERLGSFHRILGSGMKLCIPVLDRVKVKTKTSELLLDVPPQDVFTKDTVSMKADSVVYYNIMNPRDYAYGAADVVNSMRNLTFATLRNIIGTMDLEACLRSRDEISKRMLSDLDKATDKWGIKVTRVEIVTFQPPRNITEAMERQMKADRESREMIIRAEGEKKATILNAEKDKEVTILKAQAARDAAAVNAEAARIAIVQKAEAEKEALLLKAEAEKEAEIKKAEAEAEAIRIKQQATADGLKAINAANPSDGALRLKAYEAFMTASNGQATKIIVPADMQGIVGMASSIKDVLSSRR